MEGMTVGIVLASGICAGMTIYYTVDSVVSHWRRVKLAEYGAALKQQMVEKGYTADEIVRVLTAGTEAAGITTDGDDLSAALIDGGYEATDVAAITAAVDDAPDHLRPSIRSAVHKMVDNGYEGDNILKFVERRVESAAGTPA